VEGLDEARRSGAAIQDTDPYHPVIVFAGLDAELEDLSQAGDVLAGPVGRDDVPSSTAPETVLHFVDESRFVGLAAHMGTVAVLPSRPRQELRALALGALAAGANGIILDARDWANVQPVIAEIAQLIPFLAAERVILPVSAGYPCPAALLSSGTSQRLIVVNPLPQAREITWEVPGSRDMRLRDVSSGGELRAVKGRVADRLGPCEARVYDLAAP
jgi:hypothetical protein